MSDTTFGTNEALTVKRWSATVFKEAIKDTFFKGYSGPGQNNIIMVDTELTKSKGDKMTFPLKMRLTGSGVDLENEDLEGNEEEITFEDFSVTLELRGNAVKAKSEMDEQRPAFSLRSQFRDSLRDWMTEYIDSTNITALITSPTTNRNIFGGDATSDATIETADTLLTTVISKAKRTARLATPKILPIMYQGQSHYLMLVHDYQSKALKAETAWINAQKDGNVRGSKNPLFSGALGMWDGVVVKEYERIPLYSNWGSTGLLTGARAMLLGAQAGVNAYGQMPRWYEKKFQYERIPGVAITIMWKAAKVVFDSEDFGCVAVDTYYAAD
jgi:N4-gp56 family major capsid protein